MDVEISFGMVGIGGMGREKMEREGSEKGIFERGPVWHCWDYVASKT